MGTKIEWCSEVWNVVTGCTPISEGCEHCWAERMAKRLRGRHGYPADEPFRVTLHSDRLDQPLCWRKLRRVFVCSMGDLFHADVPLEFIDDVFRMMMLAPKHQYLILTKRPTRMYQFVVDCETEALERAWLGTTVESAKHLDRIDVLRDCPAAIRWLSCEPLLGPLDNLNLQGIHWVVVGGESGPGARPMHPDWARGVRDQCVAAGVPFFFKQWGQWQPWADTYTRQAGWRYVSYRDGLARVGPPEDRDAAMQTVGKKAAGRILDGRTWDQYPAAGGEGA